MPGLSRKPRKGEKIIYNNPMNDEPAVEYIVMGQAGKFPDIVNIATPESYARDGGHESHTQVIWNHADGPNPWLSYAEKTLTHPITGSIYTRI